MYAVILFGIFQLNVTHYDSYIGHRYILTK